MWKIGGILESADARKRFDDFAGYLKIPVTGNPKGQIRPKTS
jgi:hypothetical protein